MKNTDILIVEDELVVCAAARRILTSEGITVETVNDVEAALVLLPELNCRTCAFSTPEKAGGWSCARHRKGLDEVDQYSACGDHIYIPALVKMDIHDSGEDWVEYVTEEGEVVRNHKGRMGNA